MRSDETELLAESIVLKLDLSVSAAPWGVDKLTTIEPLGVPSRGLGATLGARVIYNIQISFEDMKQIKNDVPFDWKV